ncbi:hypothetical protein [Calothrix sp. PCC 7507]|uniref:hypothetical protein n=1 Tax=Calothrix sp. PCC 7507 TaxID=99598 RepID=UPI00029F2AC3|nr:hypothetical protein [Calothrix sp. PCC 7507]AFY32852.1 hypothetical protein Cal7507_2421 [Calothrix sp. PCC 7507]
MKNQLTAMLTKTQKKAPLIKSGIISALALAIAFSGPALATSKKVDLVRLDSSDCTNSNVTPASGPVGGFISVHAKKDRELVVNVHIKTGTPNTKYNIFLKCKQQIGTLYTNKKGLADAEFKVSKDIVPSVFAFDMYPDGAPLGNKFQSVQVQVP